MTGALRGNGLFDAHDALAALAANPQQLDWARQRFDDSPPPYQSEERGDASGETTLPESPSQPAAGPDQGRPSLAQRKLDLARQHDNSLPLDQFRRHTHFLARRFAQKRQHPEVWERYVSMYLGDARALMQERWREQGIWLDTWGDWPAMEAQWKHELRENPPAAESDAEKRERQRQRQASRPYHQFLYQVAKERDWLLGDTQEFAQPPRPWKPWGERTHRGSDADRELERRDAEAAAEIARPKTEPSLATPPDINTAAYEAVQKRWMEWRIWDRRWGVLPGMLWMHEEPMDAYVRRELAEDPHYAEGLEQAPGQAQDAHAAAALQSQRPHEPEASLAGAPSAMPQAPRQVDGEAADSEEDRAAPQNNEVALGPFGYVMRPPANEPHRGLFSSSQGSAGGHQPAGEQQPVQDQLSVTVAAAENRELAADVAPRDGGVRLADELQAADPDPQEPPRKRGRPKGGGRPKSAQPQDRRRLPQPAANEVAEDQDAQGTQAAEAASEKPSRRSARLPGAASEPSKPKPAKSAAVPKEDAAATPRGQKRKRGGGGAGRPAAKRSAAPEEEGAAPPRQERARTAGRPAAKRRRAA